MSSLSTPIPAIRHLPGAVLAAVGILLGLSAIGVAYVSITGFALLAAATLVMVALAALRWPRALLVGVALAPILDRFLIARVMPAGVQGITQYFSEILLLVVGLVLLADGVRRGRVVAAFRTPATIALGAFVLVAIVSTALNAVPPLIAGAGIVYTVDAIALFYLARIVGFDERQAMLAIGAVVLAVTVMAFIGFLQGLLDPNLFGLHVVEGRSGESVRAGSIVRDPNILGTLIGLTLPFPLFGIVHFSTSRLRWLAGAAALILAVALLLTYSRGSWLGVVAGLAIVLLFLDQRVFLVALAIGAMALGVATYMPRDLLVPGDPTGAGHKTPQFDVWDTTQERISAVGEGRDLRTLFVLNAIPILRDHPLAGVGPGRYGGAVAYDFKSPIYTEYGTAKLLTAQRTVDNFWLHILVETGVLGAAALIAMLVALGYRLVRVAVSSRGGHYILAAGALGGAATVTVATGTTMLLEGNTVAFVFWFILGVASLLVMGPGRRRGANEGAAKEATGEATTA
jgi:O-antigen ligase